jgi:(2Fe-2S) ferredoxin
MYIRICTNMRKLPLGLCGIRCGARKIVRYPKKRLHQNKPKIESSDIDIDIKKAKYPKRCSKGPVLIFYPAKKWYRYGSERDIDVLVTEYLVQGRVGERLLLTDSRERRSALDEQAL